MHYSDLSVIADIESNIHAHPWTEGMFSDAFHAGYSGWILVENSANGTQICAYLIIQIILDECHILTIGVKKEKQRLGYAKQLLNFLLDNQRNNSNKILLEVQESNIPAVKLYQQFDFKQIGIRKNYYQHESALVFERSYACNAFSG